MTRNHRVIALALLGVAALAACRKKPETAVTPVTNPTPTETCDAACQRARADSIREAEARRVADSIRLAGTALERAKAAARASLTARILFDYDMSDIRGDARTALDGKLAILRKNPTIRLRISGHADERGSDDYNLALGQSRAVAAKRYLTDNGIDPSRIDVVSYGEARPSVPGSEEGAWSQNRRAEFEIIAGDVMVP